MTHAPDPAAVSPSRFQPLTHFSPLKSGPFPRPACNASLLVAVAEAAKQDEIVSKVFKELDSAAVSLVSQTRLNVVFIVILFHVDSS
jgi:hypothetical protein